MEVCFQLFGEYAAFWAIDRICKYFVDRDYEKRYQIWRSEFEILLLVICLWFVWFRSVPWVFLSFTLLTWLASVPKEGHEILFRGKFNLIVPVFRRAFQNTLRQYELMKAGLPGASDNASLIEKGIFAVIIAFSRLREKLNLSTRVQGVIGGTRQFWRDTMENYRNMELETPNQSYVTHKSVSFETSPTVYTFSPPQMSSTPINHYSSGANGATPHSITVARRVSLRRQAKSNHSAAKTP